MATIERIKGRRENQSPSGYTRLFGNPELGNLMSKIQGAVIASGTELEKLIWERVKQIDDFDDFISHFVKENRTGVWVAKKSQVKTSKYINTHYEPDFLAFDLIRHICYVIEVKDGDQFDTKKSHGESVVLHEFANSIKYALPIEFQIRICCFNAQTKNEIYNGLKHQFSLGEILTGQELCELLEINFLDIITTRYKDQEVNIQYFIKELMAIALIKEIILTELRQGSKQEQLEKNELP